MAMATVILTVIVFCTCFFSQRNGQNLSGGNGCCPSVFLLGSCEMRHWKRNKILIFGNQSDISRFKLWSKGRSRFDGRKVSRLLNDRQKSSITSSGANKIWRIRPREKGDPAFENDEASQVSEYSKLFYIIIYIIAGSCRCL